MSQLLRFFGLHHFTPQTFLFRWLPIILVVTLPITIWAVLTGRFELRKKAASNESVTGFSFKTSTVEATADSFYINTNGQYYWANRSNVTVNSDPGNPNYTTLEVTWDETLYNGIPVPMRLYIYFKSDGTKWWSEKIRTYNGQPGNYANWVYYKGLFFNQPLGQAFTGDLDLTSATDSQFTGRIHFSNLQLRAFTSPPNDCYYQQVQCIQAPCNPILVCPTTQIYPPTPTPGLLSCSGKPNGSLCANSICNVCPSGVTCTANCSLMYGTCQNQYCIPYYATLTGPACVRFAPTIAFESLPSQQGAPGQTLNYKIRITNKDTTSCGSTYFTFITPAPNGWSTSASPQGVTLQPGGDVLIQVAVTSAASATAQTYNIPLEIQRPNQAPISYTAFVYQVTQPAKQLMEFLVKLAGVADGSANGARATFRFIRNTNGFDLITQPVQLVYSNNGVYKALLNFSNSEGGIGAGSGYSIVVKGEKHVAAKFCKNGGQTEPCKPGESITIPTPSSVTPVLDFTGIPLSPGDLPPQDGKADTADFNKIKTLMTKACSALTADDKKQADLDYDGCVTIKDAFLMRKTLETRYDEN